MAADLELFFPDVLAQPVSEERLPVCSKLWMLAGEDPGKVFRHLNRTSQHLIDTCYTAAVFLVFPVLRVMQDALTSESHRVAGQVGKHSGIIRLSPYSP